MGRSFMLRSAHIMRPNGDFTDTGDVLVEDGIIRIIGKDLNCPRDIPQWECKGLWLMPGVFDCHAHVGMSTNDVLENLNTHYSTRVLETARNLKTMLRSGVTWVRDAGGTDAGVRMALERDLITGPGLQVSVSLLCQTGGHMDTYLPGEDVSISSEGFMPAYPGRPDYVVDGADAMRKAVRTVIRAGADWIKLCTTGGIFSGMDGALAAQFSAEEMAVAAAEAGKAGRPVMVHAVGGDGVTLALESGIRSLEHGIYLNEEHIALMKRHGTFLVPTLTIYHHLADLAAMPNSPLPPELVASGKKLKKQLGQSVRMADEAGVPIALGVDSASRDTHGHSLEEIYWLCQAGLSIEKALTAATLRGAQLCGCADTLGQLLPGFRFDAILLEQDPSNPAVFREPGNVTGVFLAGEPVLTHPCCC